MHVNPTSYSVVTPFTFFPLPFTISWRAGKSNASSIPAEYHHRHHTIKLSRPIGSSRPRHQASSLTEVLPGIPELFPKSKKTPANGAPHDGSGKYEPDTYLHLGTKNPSGPHVRPSCYVRSGMEGPAHPYKLIIPLPFPGPERQRIRVSKYHVEIRIMSTTGIIQFRELCHWQNRGTQSFVDMQAPHL
jgi:hypothetical protein